MMKGGILLFVLLMTFKIGSASSFVGNSDSLALKKRIKERWRASKQLRKRSIIYRLNTDTLIFVGRNRDETLVGTVMIEDYKSDVDKIFIYDSSGLFHVTVWKKFRKKKRNRRQAGFVYFEDGRVIKQGGLISLVDSTRLLHEAAFLREYVIPFKSNLR